MGWTGMALEAGGTPVQGPPDQASVTVMGPSICNLPPHLLQPNFHQQTVFIWCFAYVHVTFSHKNTTAFLSTLLQRTCAFCVREENFSFNFPLYSFFARLSVDICADFFFTHLLLPVIEGRRTGTGGAPLIMCGSTAWAGLSYTVHSHHINGIYLLLYKKKNREKLSSWAASSTNKHTKHFKHTPAL